MHETGIVSSDRELCGRILNGAAAIGELQERFRKPLERFLIGMCDRGDGQSQNKAVEIASQVLADCFAKSPPLLEQWKGNDNMEAFLRAAAGNRLKSYWASAEKKRMIEQTGTDRPEGASEPDTGTGDEEIRAAREVLQRGVDQAARGCPEGLVFLRLKGLHGVDQRAISECWGHHESQTSRRVREAMNIIRTTAGKESAKLGLELTFEDFQQALQSDPSILLGAGGAMPGPGDVSTLRTLASGKADDAIKRKAVVTLCANPAAIGFFGQLLNRDAATELVIAKNPELSGMGARLANCILCSLDTLRPEEARGLIGPLMSDLFADALRSVRADGGTLWLLRPGEAVLEAVFNPFEPEIAGKCQPLVSGIVSLVFATGESQCVGRAGMNSRHSEVIDIAMGKTTRSMIAVPFAPAGITRGVLTAVHLGRDDAFGLWETGIIERQALVMSEIFVSNLGKIIAS